MQRTRSIKWGLIAAMLVLALSVCAACTRGRIVPYGNSNLNPNGTGVAYNTGTRVIEGYIDSFDRNNITVDEVEFLTPNDTTRIKELGLDTTRDFRNGYYIRNDGSRARETLPLASNVQVRFAETTYSNGYGTGTGSNNAYGGTGAGLNSAYNGASTAYGYGMGGSAGTTYGDGYGMGVGVGNGAMTGGAGYGVGTGYSATFNAAPNNVAGNTANLNNPAMNIGQTWGGVAGGMLGGVEMMADRFARGMDASGKTPYFITITNGYVTSIEEVGAYSNFAGTASNGTMNNSVSH